MYKLIFAIVIMLGMTFRFMGQPSAAEAVCLPAQPHVAFSPVCLDIPLGPRFTVRK